MISGLGESQGFGVFGFRTARKGEGGAAKSHEGAPDYY